MRVLIAALLLSFAVLALGHGAMNQPRPRNDGGSGKQVVKSAHSSIQDHSGVGCEGDACMWFSQGCTIGCPKCTEDNKHFVGSLCGSQMKPTITEQKLRTYQNDARMNTSDWTAAHPWRAPGSAPVLDACGFAGGSSKNNDAAGGFAPPGHKMGDRGSQLAPLPAGEQMHWKAGSVVEVAWGIAANHGGGYQYRLCPRSAEITEECFERMPLAFVGESQWLRFANGTRAEIPATRVSEGTFPKGSTWTMNPIPACKDPSGGFHNEKVCGQPQFPPPPGCDATCWGFMSNATVGRVIPSILDRVQLPPSLEPGEYVLGWRWDCEQTPQVWSSCSDITIEAQEARAGTVLV